MSKPLKKPVLPTDIPPMVDFEIDEVIAVLMGVKPPSGHKPAKPNKAR